MSKSGRYKLLEYILNSTKLIKVRSFYKKIGCLKYDAKFVGLKSASTIPIFIYSEHSKTRLVRIWDKSFASGF